jgi:hydrogenase maturation factor
MKYPPGKLPNAILDKLIRTYITPSQNGSDLQVIMGAHVGQDNAVVEPESGNYLVVKTDPITFATEEIGSYVVNINANDIATAGAKPKWFMPVLLLPEKHTDDSLVDKIFSDIAITCQKLNAAIIGGHTEITFGLDRPIVIGTMFGEVEKSRLITTMGAKPGDALIMTKGIVIEGAAIMARERETFLLEHGISQQVIDQVKDYLYDPGISVVKEALLLADNFTVHAMHDPTEGGLAMGIVELAQNSNCGIRLDPSNIIYVPESKSLCEVFGLNPLGTISSGTLIAAVPNEEVDDIISFLAQNNINAAKIGELTDEANQYFTIDENGVEIPLEYSQTDEITKIFNQT